MSLDLKARPPDLVARDRRARCAPCAPAGRRAPVRLAIGLAVPFTVALASSLALAACATPTADRVPPGAGDGAPPALQLESSGTGPVTPVDAATGPGTAAAPAAPAAAAAPSLATYVPWAVDGLDVFAEQAAVLDQGMADLDQNPGLLADMHFKIGLGVAVGLINAKAAEIAAYTAVPAEAEAVHADLRMIADAALEAAAAYNAALNAGDEPGLRDAHTALRQALSAVPAVRSTDVLSGSGPAEDG